MIYREKTQKAKKKKTSVLSKITTRLYFVCGVMCIPSVIFTGAFNFSGQKTETSSFVVTLSANEYQISEPDAAGYQNVTMTGFENNTLEPGDPDLPVKNFFILMPSGAKLKDLEIIPQEKETIKINGLVDFTPTPQPVAALKETKENNANPSVTYEPVPEVSANAKIYQADLAYPQKILETGHSGKMRKYDLASLKLTPFQYKPLSKELTAYKTIEVRITYKIEAKSNQKMLADLAMDSEVKDLVINYDQFANQYQPAAAQAATYHYVIIASQALASSQGMTDLVNYRQNQGYRVRVETTEYINSNFSGLDISEKIRNYLIANYLNWGFKYVALVGSHALIPMKYCNNDTPNDYYFQDLNGAWDPTQSNCGPNVDWYPEVYVGRLPFTASQDLLNYVNRLKFYETTNDPYKKRALLAAGIWYDPCDAANTAEYLKNDVLAPNGYQTSTMYEQTGACACNLSSDYDLSHANVVNHWKDDHYGLVYLAAHGNVNIMQSNSCPSPEILLQTTDVPQLSNNYPSLIFAFACYTANPAYPANLANTLLSQGGISYVGSTDLSYTADKVYRDYFDNLISQKQTDGKALAQARLNYPGYQALNYNLFSEPLLNLSSYSLDITSLKNNQAINNTGSIAIEGNAFGTNFDRYTLEWGIGRNPSSWSSQNIILENSGTQQKTMEERLGTWDVSENTMPNDYTLKLTGYFGAETHIYTTSIHLNNYLTWGSQGSGNSQFRYPSGLEINNNRIYVVDKNNYRLQVFDANGNYLTQWGSYGTGNGQFSSLGGIAADSTRVYVVDSTRIQVFDANGNYLTQWGSYGTGNGQFISPMGIEADNGRVYVGDLARIKVFDANGNYLTQWGSYGTGNGQFNIPYGLAFDNGRLYVADKGNNRIQVFNANGTYITQWGSPGTGNGQFDYPTGLTVSNQKVYVADNGNNRLQVFDTAGKFITKWGSAGRDLSTGPGYFDGVIDVKVNNGQVYVTDSNNHRIQVFHFSYLGFCSDSTFYGQCSSNKPNYCQDGQLINACQKCGCSISSRCQNNGICSLKGTEPKVIIEP